ncbi:DUF6777 domain-containing protein [Actinocorallia longicatena]|uniref:DUF6777 domain-containing protein n=1 Tax=Actinocorallia longicatena TaxID=111803 RepID=A0ABP6QG91_9ACTN
MGALAGCGGAGATITRLAVGDPGPDAYTLVSGVDDAAVTRRVEAGGQMGGDQPGLYGGTRKTASCDKDALVAFLQGNPDKAKAWADVHGIAADTIKGFVDGLTPAVLRVDTFVTNHGFRSGKATAMQAVLQAGIGVLVDGHGLPVVKCNCGNPLTAPDKNIKMDESSFKGAEWPGFDKDKVTVIESPGKDVKSLQLVDSKAGTIFDRPTGSAGGADGKPQPIPPPAQPAPAPQYSLPPGTTAPGEDRPGTTAPSSGPPGGTADPGPGTAPPPTAEPPASQEPPPTNPPDAPPVTQDPPGAEVPPKVQDPPQEDPPQQDPPQEDPPKATTPEPSAQVPAEDPPPTA